MNPTGHELVDQLSQQSAEHFEENIWSTRVAFGGSTNNGKMLLWDATSEERLSSGVGGEVRTSACSMSRKEDWIYHWGMPYSTVCDGVRLITSIKANSFVSPSSCLYLYPCNLGSKFSEHTFCERWIARTVKIFDTFSSQTWPCYTEQYFIDVWACQIVLCCEKGVQTSPQRTINL